MILNKETGEIVNSAQYTVVPEGSIYLDKNILNLSIGDTAKLTAFIGADKESNDIEWHSSDTSVATVDSDGTVTGCGTGSAVISATCSFGTAECQINVSLIGSICTIDGIRYKIKSDNTCMVALPENGKRYDMEIINIPSQIEAFGNKFVVDELEWGGFVGVFNRCPNLVEVTLPNTISYIPGDTFEYCEKLTTVNLPSSIKFIDAFAFTGCSSLSHIDLKEGLTGLWSWAFAWCPNLKDIELPASLENMGFEMFHATQLDRLHCKALTPPTVIGELFTAVDYQEYYRNCALVVPEQSVNAYQNAEYWNKFEIIVPDDVILNKYRLSMNIGDSYQLEVVNCEGFPVDWVSEDEEVVNVDASGNITALSLGETTVRAEYNGKHAECIIKVSMENLIETKNGLWYRITGFDTCEVIPPVDQDHYDFEDLIIPSIVNLFGQTFAVTSIGEMAIHDNNRLKNVDIPTSVLIIDRYAFSGCSNLEELVLPESIREIKQNAFFWCKNLKEIILPENLIVLGRWVFESCSNLNEITIPASVLKIEKGIFSEVNLNKIKIDCKIPPETLDDLFSESSNQYEFCELFVPEQSVDLYKTHPIYGKFSNLQTFDSGVESIVGENNRCNVYTLSGVLVANNVCEDSISNIAPSGLYILRFNDGRVKKIVF